MGRKKKGGGEAGGKRATTNVGAVFEQSQVQEFKEAFLLLDQNRDGFCDKEDMKDTFASLGKPPDEEKVNKMVGEASEPISFTVFLALFGSKMSGSDPESALQGAFKQFDPRNKGFLPKALVKEVFCEKGDKFKEEEWNQLLAGAGHVVDKKGRFHYPAFCRFLKGGEEEDVDE